jgi:hypothetical protein
MSVDERRRQQTENEMAFRSINENIEDLGERWLTALAEQPGERAYDYVCECQNLECRTAITLTIAEYEAVRKSGRRFVVAPAPDHFDSAIEHVVETNARYWVVEKTDEPGQLAETGDPRDK